MTTSPQSLPNVFRYTREDAAATGVEKAPAQHSWTDEEIVSRVLAREVEAFELIMRRYNSRLFRVCVSILRSEAEAEDVVQDAYVRAFQHLRQFAGRSMFSTWLTRIAIHEALGRAKKLRREEPINVDDCEFSFPAPVSSNPERNLAEKEMKVLLETAILSLPDSYRSVRYARRPGHEHARNRRVSWPDRRKREGQAASSKGNAAQETFQPGRLRHAFGIRL